MAEAPDQDPKEEGEDGDTGKGREGGGGGREGPQRSGHHEPGSSAATGGGKSAKKKKGRKGGGEKGAKGVGDAASNLTPRNVKDLFQKLSLDEQKKEHEFWNTQPVPKMDDKITEAGPVEEKDHVRAAPLSLPSNFVWTSVNLSDDSEVSEVYELLHDNYVEDDDNLFRFDYSKEFLRWALQPPGWKQAWHCGIRAATSGKLLGFISAVPACIRIRDHTQEMVEINFLCVHKKLRNKKVAPVLIKEITRRVNMEGIFQAVYTAGVMLPKPISSCKYWHRSLNPKKLVDVEFSSIPRNMTLQRMIRLYRLPETTKTIGLRPMEPKDIPTVLKLVSQYMEKFDLVPIFRDEAELAHWLLPRPGIVTSCVVENPESHIVTDFFSFYHLPSTVMSHSIHKVLNVSYSFYNVSTVTPLKDLVNDMLIIAKSLDSDVFNALDLMDNKTFLTELKFGQGDGNLHYYLFNWKCPEMPSEKVALVLQ